MITNKVRKYISEFYGNPEELWWKSHIESVVNYTKLLSKKFGGDKEIVEIAALLHDIRKMKGQHQWQSNKKLIDYYHNHHVEGAEEAEKILLKFKYPLEKIEKVKNCILTHSKDKNYPPKTIEAKILATADALSYFDHFMEFAHWVYNIKKESINNGRKILAEKFKGAWDKMMPEAKKIGKDKYEMIMKILDNRS